jgi:hypothetical protein
MQINAEFNEIIQSAATVDNVDIITAITAAQLNQREGTIVTDGVITNTSRRSSSYIPVVTTSTTSGSSGSSSGSSGGSSSGSSGGSYGSSGGSSGGGGYGY